MTSAVYALYHPTHHHMLKFVCARLQLMALYRLHLQNSSMPPQFSTLLQLRELLEIPDTDAEQLEMEVFESGASFSI